MDRQQIALKLAVDGLGLDLKVESFRDRLILQKVVYLVQGAGIHLGYYYQWYLHGPYSPSLTRDGYTVAADCARGLDDSKSWTLDKQSRERLEGLRRLVKSRTRAHLARELELLASVHFLITRQQVAEPDDDQQIADLLKRFGKDFDREDVERARSDLCEYALF